MSQSNQQRAQRQDGPPIMKESDDTCQRILKYIVSYKKERDGNSPSYRQIALEVQKGLATVAYHIAHLRDLGVVRPGSGQQPIELAHGRYDYGEEDK